jgi:hypothetical protein
MEVTLLCDNCNNIARIGCRCAGIKSKFCQDHFLNHFQSYGLKHTALNLNEFDQCSDPDISERGEKLKRILTYLQEYDNELDNAMKKTREVYDQIINLFNRPLYNFEAKVQNMKAQCAQNRQEILEYTKDAYIDVRELFLRYNQDNLGAIFESFAPVHTLEVSHFLNEIEEIEAKNREIEAKDREIAAKDRQIAAKDREIEDKNKEIEDLDEEISSLQINHKANIQRESSLIPNQISGNLQRFRALSEESKEGTNAATEEDIESNSDFLDSSNSKEIISVGKKYSVSELDMFLEESNEKLSKRKRLNLSYNDFRDNHVNSLSRYLSSIIKLNLSNNKITSTGFDLLANTEMENLLELDLSSNQIIKLNLNDQNWPRLEVLILASNKITDEGIQSLHNASLSNLRILNLSKNKMSSNSLNIIFNCSFELIEHLDLSQNKYLEFKVNHLLHRFKNLKRVDLEHTSVGVCFINSLSESNVTTIEHLNISEDKSNPFNLHVLVEGNFRYIKILNLNFCKLRLQGLNELKDARLDNLEVLSLEECGIRIEANQSFPNLNFPSLQHLNLNKNQIRANGCRGLVTSCLPNLKKLKLSGNELGSGLNHLAKSNFTSLDFLDLENNDIDSEGSEILGNSAMIQSIKILYLAHNLYSKALFFTKLGNLKTLDLESTELKDQGTSELANAEIPNLEVLNIASNRIGIRGMQSLSKARFSKLISLNLRNNKIQSEGLSELKNSNFDRLVSIDLTKTNLDERCIESLSSRKFRHLQHLYLGDNKFDSTVVERLIKANLNELVILDLSNNSIDKKSIEALAQANLPKLQQLDLRSNKFSAKAIEVMMRKSFKSLIYYLT